MPKATVFYSTHFNDPEYRDEVLTAQGFNLKEPIFEWMDANTEKVTYFQGDEVKEYTALCDNFADKRLQEADLAVDEEKEHLEH